MIRISQLTFQYPDSEEFVLQDVNLEIEPKTLTLVMGPSGSGKTTLLRCINGLVPRFSGGEITGQVNVLGLDPIKQGVKDMAPKVGMVFQEPESQFVFDIVEDELAFALENKGMEQSKMHQRVDMVLEDLGINHLRKRTIREISGGEKQKVAIASVLVFEPSVLLLDEPTSQLDPQSADEVLQLIVSLKEKLGLTVLISEHRTERLLPYTNKVVYISHSHRVEYGSPHEIIPKKKIAPPIIQIADKLNLKPVPLFLKDFPSIDMDKIKPVNKRETKEEIFEKEVVFTVENLSTKINKHQVLKNVSLSLNRGEIFTLIGQNGSGKTTLLRSILGLIPSEGKKYFNGKNIGDLPSRELIQHFAYLPQNPNDLLFSETIIEELRVTLKNHGITKDETQLKAFLNLFSLSEKSERYPRDLSVGERQRTALAAITVHDPEIILLDEPTRGLDTSAKEKLTKVLQDWRNSGKTIFLVTQDVEFAAGMADRAAILEAGKIIFNGSPRIAFTQFPVFQTQTARLFPKTGWIRPQDVTTNI